MTKNIPDVFHAFLVQNANFSGEYEIPILQHEVVIPNKVILFSDCIKSKDYDSWVIFYEHDKKFVRIWNNPRKYTNILKRFNGVISPDFSLYRSMPLCMQIWNTYRSRALAHFWQTNGIKVIPNIRFSDERSYKFCFNGIPKNSVIAVGTHGCIKNKKDRIFFKNGLDETVKVINPSTIIVYGPTPDDLFLNYKNQGINIINFLSKTELYYQSKKAVM
ncbi:MAG: DUF4417 domain-containing protein [Clostridia bacterium]